MLNNLTSPQASLAGSIIGGITSSIGAIGQVKRAKKIAQFENDLAVQNMKLQNEMNQENWIAQQEYNTPARQLQRLQEAGLNPNLMYQSAPSNVATSPQDSGDFYAPNVDSPDVAGAFNEVGKQIGGIMSNYMQNKAVEQNIQESKGREMQTHAQTTLLQDQLLTNAQNRLVQINEELRKQDLHPIERDFLSKQRDKTDQEIKNLQQTFAHNIDYLQLHKNQDNREQRELNQFIRNSEFQNALNQVKIEFEAWNKNFVTKNGRLPSSSSVNSYLGDLIQSYFGPNNYLDKHGIPNHGIIKDIILSLFTSRKK